ncbi:TolC family outer membrane protein [Chitinibacter sp. S2-10]|uniref:TolC family outer membrane protein n=1 Tax=Chitinibacter sp. S2-10 TaxID=3373597 RepID=UPI0039773594
MLNKVCFAILSACGLASAYAVAEQTGPYSAFKAALNYDSSFQAANHQYQAEQLETGISRSALLPRISLLGNLDKNTEIQGFTRNTTRTTQSDYDRAYYQAVLQQPMFNLPAWYGYQQGVKRAETASYNLKSSKDQLLMDLITAYAQSIYEEKNIDLSRSLIKTLEAQIESAQRQFAAGTGTITDVYSAQSKKDLAAIELIEAGNRQETALRKLKQLTGIDNIDLKPLRANGNWQLPITGLQQLQTQAMASNPDLAIKQSELEQTTLELHKTRAAFLPRLDFVAQTESFDRKFSNFEDSTTSRRFGLELTIAFLDGGRDIYRERQLAELREKSRAEVNYTSSSLGSELDNQYQLFKTAEKKIEALKLAQESSEHYVYASKKSYEAGVRTLIDTLDADRQLYQARRDLAQSYLQYILSWLKVMTLTGNMNDEQLILIDQLFG